MALSDRTKERIFYALTDRVSQAELSDLIDELEAYKESRVISTATTLYVTTAGNDTTGDGSVGNPYRNPQAALNSLVGVHILAAVTVSVSAGTFDGFAVPTLTVTGAGSVTIAGTTADATLTAGTATGSWTSTASNNGTDAGQSWTVNDLKGRILEFTGPSGVQWSVISGNTATAITLFSGTTPTNGTAYRVLDNVSAINCNLAQPFNTVTMGLAVGAQDSNGYPVAGTAVGTAGPGTSLWIRNFSFTPAAGQYFGRVNNSSASVAIEQCTFVAAATTNFLVVSSSEVISNCFFKTTANFAILTQSANAAGGYHAVNTCLFQNTAGTSAISINGGSWVVNFCAFDSALGTGSAIAVSTTVGNVSARVVGNTYTNCTTVASASVPCFFSMSSGSGSGNTNGIVISKGARVQVASNVAFGATNELSVDGTVTTLAAMRALTPKAYPASPNAYGTVIYE